MLFNKRKYISPNDILVSETDCYGYIQFANEAFARACNIPVEVLKGNNHNVIKHPDIPDWVFRELWDTIIGGDIWEGVIANRVSGTNEHYWVKAIIMPKYCEKSDEICGYISTRKKATEEEIQNALMEYDIEEE